MKEVMSMSVVRHIVKRCMGFNKRHESMTCRADRIVEKIAQLEQRLREHDAQTVPPSEAVATCAGEDEKGE